MNIIDQLLKRRSLLIIFILALIFRLSISHLGFHDDMYSNTAWGEWIYKYGPDGFYESRGWINSSPTQPPIINLLYGFNHFLYEKLMALFGNIGILIANFHLVPTKMLWFFDFARWFSNSMYQTTPFRYGALISMKIVAIIVDLMIAGVIFILARHRSPRPYLWSAAYLFSPFSWYLSSLWGQYDQTSFLFLLLAFVCLAKRYLAIAPLLLLISLELKPTSIIFIPLFLVIYFKQKPSVKTILLGGISSGMALFYSIWLYRNHDILDFIHIELIPRIFLKSEFRISTNAFNFWRIFIGNAALNQATVLFLLPTNVWSYLIFLILYVFSLRFLKEITSERIFGSLSIIGVGGWLFLTNMLDRYLFSGIVFLLIVCIYRKEFFKYWLLLSLIFWLNLYNQWWFPEQLGFIKQVLTWQEMSLSRFLAAVNVVVFLIVAKKLYDSTSGQIGSFGGKKLI